TDDTAAVFPNYLSMSTVRTLVGLDGTVMNGISPEQRDLRAIANHSGLLNHVFLGQSRNEPLSPMGITLDSAVVQPDLSLNWDLRLANGNYAAPGTYRVYLYTIDPQAGRFHGAVGTFTLSPQNVPFSVTGLRLSSTNFVNPANNGGIVLDFNATRSANTTVQILDAANHVVATIASSQFLEGRTDTNAPIQVWWDGYTNGVPAAAGNYRFRLTFGTDGVTTNFDSAFFTLSYPTNSPRESNWGLLTQPIAFDPDTRDRIMHNPDLAWVTLHFDAGVFPTPCLPQGAA
ncbi:MAG: hypothetical protein NT154_04325, partial [Verrucomicrobia bacterium]|nr:hypothetical protein [Verrucomicrobiota bacterium]